MQMRLQLRKKMTQKIKQVEKVDEFSEFAIKAKVRP
jgi:hypothetical protein